MDTEHVRSGAALEGRPAHRQARGGQVFRGSTERLPRLPPAPGSRRALAEDLDTEQQQNGLERALGETFELKNPFDVDRDGHEHEPGQGRAGAGRSDE
jgi:hypothetical protein